jgi:DNA repair exonuclease SbcCD ATPase subunit
MLRGIGSKSWKLVSLSLRAERTAADMETEREVKKANRELSSAVSNKDHIARADAIQKRYLQLYGEMKRLEREYQKTKRRADTTQKERDTAKSELSKMTSVKDKLEKLSRDTSVENRRLRVGAAIGGLAGQC